METKKCPKCSEDVQKKAKKCKHCHADIRNWFMKHKIISFFLIILLIGAFGAAGGTNTSKTSSTTSQSENTKKVSKITKENCNLIKSGMKTVQVKEILGEPSTTSESSTAGLGTSELLHYQEAFSLKACSVTVVNGSVFSKSWTEL